MRDVNRCEDVNFQRCKRSPVVAREGGRSSNPGDAWDTKFRFRGNGSEMAHRSELLTGADLARRGETSSTTPFDDDREVDDDEEVSSQYRV
jgi:hypothetical protein